MISKSITKIPSGDSHHGTIIHKQKTTQMSNTEKMRTQWLTVLETGWKIEWVLGGKDKFGLKHAEFEAPVGHLIRRGI